MPIRKDRLGHTRYLPAGICVPRDFVLPKRKTQKGRRWIPIPAERAKPAKTRARFCPVDDSPADGTETKEMEGSVTGEMSGAATGRPIYPQVERSPLKIDWIGGIASWRKVHCGWGDTAVGGGGGGFGRLVMGFRAIRFSVPLKRLVRGPEMARIQVHSGWALAPELLRM